MSLDVEVRVSIIAQMMRKKFGGLLDWQRPELIHDFGPNDLELVEKFESFLTESIDLVQNEFEQMSNKDIEEVGTQLTDPYTIKESTWGSFLAERIGKAHSGTPIAIAYGFGHPKYAAKFEHWVRMPQLSLHEVSSLSLGADPRFLKSDMWVALKKRLDGGKKLWAAHGAFIEQREIFSRCYHFTGIDYVSEPIDKIKQWIDNLDIKVHPKFIQSSMRAWKRDQHQMKFYLHCPRHPQNP